jgi:HK97 family phage portal protein
MGIITAIKALFDDRPQSLGLAAPQDMKKAFQLAQVGVIGRAEFSTTNREALDLWSRRNELVYACIEKKKQAAIDPTPVVEQQKGENWEPIPGHPLTRLLARPNPLEDGSAFWGNWIASEDVFGEAYAEIERNSLGQPVRLWRLNPLNMKPIAGRGRDGSPIRAYEYTMNGRVVTMKAEDVLVRRKTDLTNNFFGLAPLQVAMGAVDMDTAQTDFVRAFFTNGGVPSGLLRFPNATLTSERAEEARQRFMSKYGRGGRGYNGVAVLDQNAEYQKVGANLGELESETLRCQSEARICSVFGVPPLLVGAYVGLLYVNQRASAEAAQKEFWDNTMSPLFKSLRTWLTWNLLPEFADIALVEAERIRVSWDMSKVMAMQEDVDARHDRARKNLQAGGITLNEFRAEVGLDADPEGDYYLRPVTAQAATPEVALLDAQRVPAAPTEMPSADETETDEAKALDPLRLDLIRQSVAEVKEGAGVFALVPAPKAYAHLSEAEVAEAVEEIQTKAMLVSSALSIEELGREEFAARFEVEMNK